MKFEIKKLFSLAVAKPLPKANDSRETVPFGKPTSNRVALARGLAVLFLSIPIIALAPWAGGSDETGATDAAGTDSAVSTPTALSKARQQGAPATASAATGAPSGSIDATALTVGSQAYGASPWSDSAGAGIVTADAGIPGLETAGNRRFHAAGRNAPQASGGGGIPNFALRGPGSPGFLPATALGGGSQGGRNGSPGSTPSNSMPNGNSAGSGLPSGSGDNLPQGSTGGGEGPLVSNPPVPIVDDEKILALQDDPTIQNLLPPPPAFNGDPLPANTPLLDSEEDRSILAAAAVPVPGTGWLMVLAFPLLLFFRGPPASRRR